MAKHKTTGKQYCLKIEKNNARSPSKTGSENEEDEEIFLKSYCSNIVKVNHIIKTRTKKYILFEHMPRGKLLNHMTWIKEINEAFIKYYAYEILKG